MEKLSMFLVAVSLILAGVGLGVIATSFFAGSDKSLNGLLEPQTYVGAEGWGKCAVSVGWQIGLAIIVMAGFPALKPFIDWVNGQPEKMEYMDD